MRGWWHYQQYTKEENARARICFERAVELNPQSSGAFVGLAWSLNQAILSQWTDPTAQAISELTHAATRSVQLNASSPSAQLAIMLVHSLKGAPQEAIGAAARATELNPSDPVALANLADLLVYQCRVEEAIANVEMAIRLSPRDPMRWYFFSVLAGAHFAAERYADAVEWARRSIRENSRVYLAWAYLASSYAHLDLLDEARAAFQDILRLQPNISVAAVKLALATATPDFLERYLDGLHQAGLPE